MKPRPLLAALLEPQSKPEPTEREPLRITSIEEADAAPDGLPDLTALKQLDKTSFNACAEELFLDLICRLLDEGELTVREAIVETAYELNVSPETSKRYIFKHSARRARFALIDGKVTCKLHSHKLHI